MHSCKTLMKNLQQSLGSMLSQSEASWSNGARRPTARQGAPSLASCKIWDAAHQLELDWLAFDPSEHCRPSAHGYISVQSGSSPRAFCATAYLRNFWDACSNRIKSTRNDCEDCSAACSAAAVSPCACFLPTSLECAAHACMWRRMLQVPSNSTTARHPGARQQALETRRCIHTSRSPSVSTDRLEDSTDDMNMRPGCTVATHLSFCARIYGRVSMEM